MILGEDQILGQVKDAHEFAKEHLCCGKYLNTLFRISVTGAKKVKTETLLSKTPGFRGNHCNKTVSKYFGDTK